MQEKTVKTDDRLLWQQMKSGNQNSFSVIFKTYYASLYAYGIKIVPFPDFVRDNIQNLFLNIWQKRDTLGTVNNLKSYLLVSLRRQLFSSKKYNLITIPLDDCKNSSDILFFEPNEFVDKNEISLSIKEKLLHNLNSLPVKQREIIFLRFYHQLTYKEIGEIIGVKEQSVKNIMPKILDKLKTGLADIKREDLKDFDALLFGFFLLFSKKM